MKNKKGFTLLELLAVLVIISLIAFVTIPAIVGVVKKSKDTIYQKQLQSIESAACIWGADHMLDLPNGESGTCYYSNIDNCAETYQKLIIDLRLLQNNGYISSDLKNTKTKEPFENVEIEITKNGNNKQCKVLTNDDSSSEESQSTFGGTLQLEATESTKTYKGIAYLDPTDLTATCNATLAAANVDSTTNLPTGINTGCMKFYIFDDSNNQYKMILDHNTTATTRWVTKADYNDDTNWNNNIKNDKGPITANVQLATATTGWEVTPRLITANEIAHITGADSNDTIKWSQSKTYGTDDTSTQASWFYLDGGSNSDPTVYAFESNGWQKYVGSSNYAWLFDYTRECTDYGCNTADSSNYGYWTSTPLYDDFRNAWLVERGIMKKNYVEYPGKYGVRPVITISKSLFS